MQRAVRMGIFCITSVVALMTIPFVEAQQASNSAAAPVPIQILTGTKVFISNGGSDAILGDPVLAYNEFYADRKSGGKYDLVAAPADADLILEIRFEIDPGTPLIHLGVLEPKTHVALWIFNQGIQACSREVTGRKNFSQAMSTLVGDVKRLTSSPLPAANATAPNK